MQGRKERKKEGSQPLLVYWIWPIYHPKVGGGSHFLVSQQLPVQTPCQLLEVGTWTGDSPVPKTKSWTTSHCHRNQLGPTHAAKITEWVIVPKLIQELNDTPSFPPVLPNKKDDLQIKELQRYGCKIYWWQWQHICSFMVNESKSYQFCGDGAMVTNVLQSWQKGWHSYWMQQNIQSLDYQLCLMWKETNCG